MKYIETSRSYSVFLFLILFFTSFVSHAKSVALSEVEYAEIMKNPHATYICLDKSLSNIKQIIIELSKLDKDKKSLLHSFKRYIRQGLNIGLYDEVMDVLEYAELVVRKKAAEVGKSKIKSTAKKLSEIIHKVANKELNYDRSNLLKIEELEEIALADADEVAAHRAPTIIFNENIVIEDDLIVKKKARIHGTLKLYDQAFFKDKVTFEHNAKFKKDVKIKGDLSVDAITAGSIDASDLITPVATINSLDATNAIIHSLDATNAVIDNLEVTNCIPVLCVQNLSVVDEVVSGTLSVNNLSLTGGLAITDLTLNSLSAVDAVIENLEVTNCIPFLCAEDISIVDGSVSGTLSINEAVIQILDIPGGIVVTDLSLDSLSATDAVIDNLTVLSCMDNLCVTDLEVGNSLVIDSFTTPGVIHNDGTGNLTSSLIVGADIVNGTITTNKLASATSANFANTLVLRDGLGSFVTTMITLTGSVTNPTDAATKAYVDSASIGLEPKAPAVVVATTNRTLSGLQTIDGVSLVANDRVLLTAQSSPVQNGLWLVQAGAWTRPADFASGTMAGQAYVLILSGTVNAGSSWLCSTPTAIIDTNPISFVLFTVPESTTGANVGAGTGLIFRNKTGNILNFKSIIAGTNVTVSNNANDITLGVNATSLNTANTLVQRDGSGNFSAGTITAALNGNATSSTNFTGSLSGNVVGTQNATIVNSVGGQTAANIASATVLANAATSSNTPNAIVRRNASGNFSAGTITATLNGSATSFSGSLAGDVTGTQGATVVSLVGGQTAANVAAATVLANAATTANTPNTIVRRNASGNFSAGTITANLIGNATTATSIAGSFSGDVTGTQAATVVSFVGGQSAANVAAATVLANAATNANTANTIVKRDGSGNFSAGIITATLNGTANSTINFTGTLVGDVTGTQTATVVSFVAGQSAANVGAATALANAATSTNSAGTIVRRDGSGNFSAGTITANLNGNATGFSGSLAGDVTGTQGATVVSFVGGQSAATVAGAAALTSTATSLNTPNTLVLRNASGNFSAGTITATLNGNASTATTATTAVNFSGSLAGDVTGTQGATVVSLVGGQTAANVALATVATNAATNLNTPSTIVKRDGSGNFNAGTITGNLNGTATNFSGALLGDVTGTQGATVVSFVGGQSAANVATATVAANAATSSNVVSTIVKRDGSGNFTAGTITANLTGTATNFSGALSGDVTGSQSTTIVSFVGGQTASNVAAGAVLANAATNLNTPLAIVRRDASGNFFAGLVTTATGVVFPSGGTTLDYYFAGFTGGTTFNANTGSPASVSPNVVYARIGSIVTVTIAAQTFTASGSPQFYTASGVVPAALRPTNGQVQTVLAAKIGASVYESGSMGTAVINSAGDITIRKESEGNPGAWLNATNQGWDSVTVTYCV